MKERRKSPRKNLMAYSQVFDLYGGYLLGYLGDLNLEGAMVIGERSLTEDVEITLSIELPDLPDVAPARIAIPARAVWCQPDISPEFFNVGFEFKEVTPEQSAVIQSIIENYEFRRVIPKYNTKPSAE